MTTDPFPKEVVGRSARRAAGTFRVGGIAKGSGMIEPLMATMLGFVTTDAAVEPALLQRALKAVVRRHVQRDHGGRRVLDQRLRVRARQRRERRRRSTEATTPLLVDALAAVCEPLAIGIVRGGEGATKLITVTRDRRGVGRRTRGARRGRSRIRRW